MDMEIPQQFNQFVVTNNTEKNSVLSTMML